MPYVNGGEAKNVFAITGRGGANQAFMVVSLADWAERARSQQEIVAEINGKLRNIAGVQISARTPNSLGIRGGVRRSALPSPAPTTMRWPYRRKTCARRLRSCRSSPMSSSTTTRRSRSLDPNTLRLQLEHHLERPATGVAGRERVVVHLDHDDDAHGGSHRRRHLGGGRQRGVTELASTTSSGRQEQLDPVHPGLGLDGRRPGHGSSPTCWADGRTVARHVGSTPGSSPTGRPHHERATQDDHHDHPDEHGGALSTGAPHAVVVGVGRGRRGRRDGRRDLRDRARRDGRGGRRGRRHGRRRGGRPRYDLDLLGPLQHARRGERADAHRPVARAREARGCPRRSREARTRSAPRVRRWCHPPRRPR